MITVLKENYEAFEALGIYRWHKAGYDGSLGLTATWERFEKRDNQKDNVVVWKEEECPVGNNDHGYYSAMAHLQVAPGRKIVQIWEGMKAYPPSGFFVEEFVPFMLEAKPDIGFASLIMDNGGEVYEKYYRQFDPFCSLFCSAGNDGTASYSPIIRMESWFGVGAVLHAGSGSFTPANYSSETEYVDVCGMSNVYCPTTAGTAVSFAGTSCSAPVIAGMCALVNHLFIEKTGKPLSHQQMQKFIYDHCVDIGAAGKDTKTGMGLFVLPDPASVDIEKYAGKVEPQKPPVGDSTPAEWSKEAVDWAVKNGLLYGDLSGDLLLRSNLTREQFATILKRYNDI